MLNSGCMFSSVQMFIEMSKLFFMLTPRQHDERQLNEFIKFQVAAELEPR